MIRASIFLFLASLILGCIDGVKCIPVPENCDRELSFTVEVMTPDTSLKFFTERPYIGDQNENGCFLNIEREFTAVASEFEFVPYSEVSGCRIIFDVENPHDREIQIKIIPKDGTLKYTLDVEGEVSGYNHSETSGVTTITIEAGELLEIRISISGGGTD